jgi:hypothetical protein
MAENSGSGHTGMERKYFHLYAKLVIWFFMYFGAGNIEMHWSSIGEFFVISVNCDHGKIHLRIFVGWNEINADISTCERRKTQKSNAFRSKIYHLIQFILTRGFPLHLDFRFPKPSHLIPSDAPKVTLANLLPPDFGRS